MQSAQPQAASCALMILARFKPGTAASAMRTLAFGRAALARDGRVAFFKLLGSGQGGGFSVWPSVHHIGLFCTFAVDFDAEAFLATSPLVERVRGHAADLFICRMAAFSLRGTWGGFAPCAVSCVEPADGPVAVITRASIRLRKAPAFWGYAAPAEAQLARVNGCLLAMGLGEAPLLRQVTFSIWENQAAMTRYAASDAHGHAARAARTNGYFSEEMFARFTPVALNGRWNGREFGPVLQKK